MQGSGGAFGGNDTPYRTGLTSIGTDVGTSLPNPSGRYVRVIGRPQAGSDAMAAKSYLSNVAVFTPDYGRGATVSDFPDRNIALNKNITTTNPTVDLSTITDTSVNQGMYFTGDYGESKIKILIDLETEFSIREIMITGYLPDPEGSTPVGTNEFIRVEILDTNLDVTWRSTEHTYSDYANENVWAVYPSSFALSISTPGVLNVSTKTLNTKLIEYALSSEITGVEKQVKSRFIKFKASGASTFWIREIFVFTPKNPSSELYGSSLADNITQAGGSVTISGATLTEGDPNDVLTNNVKTTSNFKISGDSWTLIIDLGADYVVGEIRIVLFEFDPVGSQFYTVDLLTNANAVTWSSDILDLNTASSDNGWTAAPNTSILPATRDSISSIGPDLDDIFQRVGTVETSVGQLRLTQFVQIRA